MIIFIDVKLPFYNELLRERASPLSANAQLHNLLTNQIHRIQLVLAILSREPPPHHAVWKQCRLQGTASFEDDVRIIIEQ